MDSTYGIASERLVNAASSYGMTDPRFNGMMDTVTRALGITPVSKMGSGAASEVKAIVSMVLNQLGIAPGQNDFLNMHRAVLQAGASGYTITDMNGSNIGSANAGTGNVSTAVAAQIAGGVRDRLSSFKAQRKGFRGDFDSGMVEGLNQDTAMQIASRVLAKRRLREGDVQLMEFNNEESGLVGDGSLRHASGSKMLEYLNKMTGVGGRYEGRRYSTEFQEMYRQADILAQREQYVKNNSEIFGGQLDLTNKKHREALEKFYKDEVKDTRGNHMEVTEADRMGIEALDRGEGKTFLVANNVTKEVSDAVKRASKNVSELSQIFDTNDLDELQAIADSMGMASITEASKVQSVRDSITRAKTMASMTGRSVKEVMEEQAGIVSSFQMAGSSVSNTMAASVQASVYASEGVGSWKSKEQREGEAMRSQEDANEFLMNVIVMRQMMEDGSLTKGQKEKAQKILNRVSSGKASREELEDLDLQSYDITHASGNPMADNPEYQKRAVSNFQGDTLKWVQAAAHPENYSNDLEEIWGSRWDSEKGNFKDDAYMSEKLKQAGGSYEGAIQQGQKEAEIFRKAFGTGSDAIRDQLFEIGQSTDDKGLRESRIKALREGLVKQNTSKEELQNFDAAVEAMMGMSKEAVNDLNVTMKSYGINDATASQDTTGMSYKMKERKNKAEVFKKDLHANVMRRKGDGMWDDFSRGLYDKIGEGADLTGGEAAVMMLGQAKTRDKNGKGIDVVNEVAELDEMGAARRDAFGNIIRSNITTYNAGQIDETKLSQEGLSKEQRRAILGAAKDEYLARNTVTTVKADQQKHIEEQWSQQEGVLAKSLDEGEISDEDARKNILDNAEKAYMEKNITPGMTAAQKEEVRKRWAQKREELDNKLQSEGGLDKDSEDFKMLMDAQKRRFIGDKREEILSQNRKDAQTKWEEQGQKEIEGKLDEVHSYGDLSHLTQQYGIDVKETEAGDAMFMSQASEERLAAETNEENKAAAVTGSKAMARRLFGEDNSFSAVARRTADTLKNSKGEDIKGKDGKPVKNTGHEGELLGEMQIVAGKYIHMNNEGKFTDVNGRVIEDSKDVNDEVMNKARQDLTDTADYMWQEIKDKGEDKDTAVQEALANIKDPQARSAMETALKEAQVREAESLATDVQGKIGLELFRDDKEKAKTAGQGGDVHRVIGAFIDDQADAEVTGAGEIKDRNKLLAKFIKAQKGAAQGGMSEMDNAYIADLAEHGYIKRNKNNEWVATAEAEKQFGDLIEEGDEIFGDDKEDIQNAMGDKLAGKAEEYGLSASEAQEIEAKHKRDAAEKYQENVVKLMANIAHNMWALADDETSHAQAMT